MSGVIETGCIYLQYSSPTFDISKPFNQTIFINSDISWVQFTGPQLPDSIPVVRGPFSTGMGLLVVGPYTERETYPVLEYDPVTGLVNATVPTGSYIIDIGKGLDPENVAANICFPTPGLTFPCINVKVDTGTPLNCQIDIDLDQSASKLCPV